MYISFLPLPSNLITSKSKQVLTLLLKRILKKVYIIKFETIMKYFSGPDCILSITIFLSPPLISCKSISSFSRYCQYNFHKEIFKTNKMIVLQANFCYILNEILFVIHISSWCKKRDFCDDNSWLFNLHGLRAVCRTRPQGRAVHRAV